MNELKGGRIGKLNTQDLKANAKRFAMGAMVGAMTVAPALADGANDTGVDFQALGVKVATIIGLAAGGGTLALTARIGVKAAFRWAATLIK